MTRQQIKKFALAVPFSVAEIEWLHDDLKPENQNEEFILQLMNEMRSNGISWEKVKEISESDYCKKLISLL